MAVSCRLRIIPSLVQCQSVPDVTSPSFLLSLPTHDYPRLPMMYMGSSHPFAPRQSRHSSSSTATYASPSDGRRAIFRKENQFIDRYGSKLHAYDRDKAPYPCSFDRDVMEVYVL